jgi:hypothetical protein
MVQYSDGELGSSEGPGETVGPRPRCQSRRLVQYSTVGPTDSNSDPPKDRVIPWPTPKNCLPTPAEVPSVVAVTAETEWLLSQPNQRPFQVPFPDRPLRLLVPPQGDLGERYKYDEDERSGDGVQYIEEETSGADTSAKRPTVQQYINSGGTLRTREVATECNTSRKKLLVLIPVIRD